MVRKLQYMTALLCLASVCGTAPMPLHAHSGGLDSKGCHTNRKTGDYHCHRPQAADNSASAAGASGPKVKKSKNGICHDQQSPYYQRTTNFTGYLTMKDCVDSGGRPPK
jgi:hypothetical protein